MLTVAILANRFPSAIESYVIDEIEELRRRGVRVISGSVCRAHADDLKRARPADVVLFPLLPGVMARALWLCLTRSGKIASALKRILWKGHEGPARRVKALAHTFLGACYAAALEGREIEHIHVHHGYFGSWIAMTAAMLLDVPFSLSLYGSDLLLHEAYLDTKLENCSFCQNVSEFNRRYILDRYPGTNPEKLPVMRVGVEIRDHMVVADQPRRPNSPLALLAVGRLHAVKDHAFLLRACAELQRSGPPFQCCIVGDGPERKRLAKQIRDYGLDEHVQLLGYVSQEKRDALYDQADVVVLTSRSEGIPVVLMEAMARRKIVLAPAITGIPELVIPGRTGFLYKGGVVGDFIEQLRSISVLMKATEQDRTPSQAGNLIGAGRLDWLRSAARLHVQKSFNRAKNVGLFCDLLMQRAPEPENETIPDENSILQQI